MNKIDIQQQLTERHRAFTADILSLSPSDFLFAPPDKWTAGQQLEHIYRSVAPVKWAFILPKMLLRLLFGKANRPSSDYETLVSKYQRKLATGGKAPTAFVPKSVTVAQKDKWNRKLSRVIQSLNRNVERYSESELDLYILPHPLLGKLTLREMLYFTIYHVEHHHKAAWKTLESAM